MTTKFYNLDTDNTLGGSSPSDNIVASEKAIKSYVDNKGYITGINSSDVTTALGYTPSNISLSNADNQAKILMSSMGMPDVNHYTDLTIGASGTTYYAPSNGWVTVVFRKNDHNYSSVTIGGAYLTSNAQADTGQGDNLAVYLPVLKGGDFWVSYLGSMTLQRFRFTYAKGSISEYS